MPNVYAVVFSVPHEMGDTLWSVHTCPDKADEAKAKAERGEGYAGSYGTFAIRVLRRIGDGNKTAAGRCRICGARVRFEFARDCDGRFIRLNRHGAPACRGSFDELELAAIRSVVLGHDPKRSG